MVLPGDIPAGFRLGNATVLQNIAGFVI